jgi:hypothetical protein
MRQPILLFAIAALFITGCDRTANTTGSDPIPDRNTAVVPRVDERDSWQQPDQLLAMMQGNIEGRTVADLFAGDGYFSFKLVEAGARVIAMDTDAGNIARLKERKRELGLSDAQLEVRQVQEGDPGLAPGEADVALMTHAFTRIANVPDYIARLRNGMKFPRPLFVIDWQYRETPVGPPLSERKPTEQIMDELGNAGFDDVGAHSAKMPHQVIFFASDPMEMDEAEYTRMMEQVRVRPQE